MCGCVGVGVGGFVCETLTHTHTHIHTNTNTHMSVLTQAVAAAAAARRQRRVPEVSEERAHSVSSPLITYTEKQPLTQAIPSSRPLCHLNR